MKRQAPPRICGNCVKHFNFYTRKKCPKYTDYYGTCDEFKYDMTSKLYAKPLKKKRRNN